MDDNRKALLSALGTVLRTYGLRGKLTDSGLYVDDPSRSGEYGSTAVITVDAVPDGRLFFCSRWALPLSETTDVPTAAYAILSLVSDNGTSLPFARMDREGDDA